MQSATKTGFYAGLAFDDFDAFSEAVEGWDLDTWFLDRGGFSGNLQQIVHPPSGFQIVRAGYSARLKQIGCPPAGTRTFCVPAREDIRVTWRGREITGKDIPVFPMGAGHEAITPRAFDVFTISVSEEDLANASADHGYPDPSDLLNGSEVFRCDSRDLDHIRKLLRSRFDGAPTNLPPRAVDFPRDELIQRLLGSIRTAHHGEPRSTPRIRRRALKQAENFIHTRAKNVPSMREICRASGASERTLEYAFREYFGITPKAYLNAVRLNEVRYGLSGADPETTKIAGVANQWGFWHMGQFAADYRRMFGELPSETLRRRRVN